MYTHDAETYTFTKIPIYMKLKTQTQIKKLEFPKDNLGAGLMVRTHHSWKHGGTEEQEVSCG